jgi:dipeptidyl-peptidase-3
MATPVPNSQAPTIHLAAKDIFDGLDDREKLYAHHMSLASWYLSRIILRQTSPEAESIFDLIVSLYHHCDGESGMLLERADISRAELDKFLSYAALFLCNLGNFYASIPSKSTLQQLMFN